MKAIKIIVALVSLVVGIVILLWMKNENKQASNILQPSITKNEIENKAKGIEFTRIDEYLTALINKNKFAGDLSIYQDGEVAYKKTLVVDGSDISESKEILKYKIGSITKTFTSVIIFQLLEQGKLTLDTKLAKFFPQMPNAEQISIDQMLNHHSGLHNYTDEQEFSSYYAQDQSKAFLIDKIASYPSDFEPGSSAAYSNSNYLLLGYIIEEITGNSYQKVVLENIIKPLKLKNTYYGDRADQNKNEVRSYYFMEKWLPTPEWSMTVAGAAGAIMSTADDLNVFFKGLFDNKLIHKESLAKMIEIKNSFGHGIFTQTYQLNGKEYKGYWHNGGLESFRAHMVYFPKEKLGYSLLSNGQNYDLSKVRTNILKAYSGEKIKIPSFKEFIASVESLIPLVGDYLSETHPLDINISLQSKKIYAQATGQGAFLLTPIAQSTFEYSAAGIEIIFDNENEQFVIKQGGRADIFTKKNAKDKVVFEVSKKILEQYVGVYASENFPLDIKVILEGSQLKAQATGQGAFPLTAISETEYKFNLADIKIIFDSKNAQLTITQHGQETLMTKK